MKLEIKNLHKRFGGIMALNGCSFAWDSASTTGLVGPNGSGKSTLFNVVTGTIKADNGQILLDGNNLHGLPPHQIARRGIGRTFQTTRLFKSLSVLDNVLLGGHHGGRDDASIGTATALLGRFGIDSLADRPADALSFGQRRLVELARTLMGKPSFILLDEPFAGLSPLMSQELEHHIAHVAGEGVGIVLIEHDLAMVAKLCERVIVLHQGCVIADGPPAQVSREPAVTESYMGGA